MNRYSYPVSNALTRCERRRQTRTLALKLAALAAVASALALLLAQLS